jgi:uncharacterized protein (DUF983 family)
MDLGIIAGVVMLVVWAIVTFVYNGPGWIHLLLTLGVTLIIWRVVVRGTKTDDQPASGA